MSTPPESPPPASSIGPAPVEFLALDQAADVRRRAVPPATLASAALAAALATDMRGDVLVLHGPSRGAIAVPAALACPPDVDEAAIRHGAAGPATRPSPWTAAVLVVQLGSDDRGLRLGALVAAADAPTRLLIDGWFLDVECCELTSALESLVRSQGCPGSPQQADQ